LYKMLLVEDEETIRNGFQVLIREVSSEFVIGWEAAHGKEALQLLESDVPDAVIADIRMREMDGLTLAGKIRERYPDMPIVIVSGHGDFAYAQQAIRTGVVDYLLKPVKRAALTQALDRVKQALRNRGVSDAGPDSDDSRDEPDATENHLLVRKVKSYIRSNPDGDLRLQNLAELVHLNPAYLSQLFKSVAKMNISDYVAKTRMDKARRLLEQTGLKIYDIARLSGYQSPKHFMLIFKEHVGCTPSDYRARHGGSGQQTD